jgi:quinol monooxygenase YgiN
MSKVSMWVTLPLKEGMRDQAIAIIQEALKNVQAEPGTLVYTLNTDPNDENVVHFYEAYTDQAALFAHGGSDWFKEFSPKLGAVLAGKPEMKFLSVVGGKGV